jgi:hypothetical protein
MLRIRPLLPLLTTAALLSALLTACGGGGGGSSSSGTPTPPPVSGPALNFTPATITGTAVAGTSATINLGATVNRPADFANASNIFAFVIDDKGVLLPGVQLIKDSDTQYHAALQTAPSLAAGSYSGNFTVKLCPDSACASQFPGSPMALPYSLQITPAGSTAFSASTAMPMTLTMHAGGAAPANVAIAVKAGSRSWTVSSNVAWLAPTPASGSGDGTVTAVFNTASLAPGSYTGNVSLQASDGSTVTLPVSLTVLQAAFQFDNNTITFSAINGAPIPTQSIAFNLDNGGAAFWSAASDVNWLGVTPTSGITPSSMILSVDVSTPNLSAGVYGGNINMTAPNVAPRSLPVALNLQKATLLGSSNTVTLGGTYGRDFRPQTWTLSLNTSTNAWPLALSGVPAWVAPAASAASISKAPVTVTLTPDPTAAPVGISSAVLGATATVNGDQPTATTLITINKDAHKLIPSETGVAMAGTPGWARISRTIGVSDNYGQTASWTAASDQPWLAVTTTANSITLTADPTALGIDTLSLANVTLTPAAADVVTPETIRVAFWKGTTFPAAPTPLQLPYTNVVADPVRPLLYAHNGGAFIDVYHAYTQQKLGTITGFSATLGDMAASPNGDHLYVLDINNHVLATVDLSTRAITTQWPLPNAVSSATRVRAIRPNGEELVVLNDGTFWQAATGKRLPAVALPGGSMAAPGDGKHLYLQDEGKSNVNLATFGTDYAALAGGTLFAARQTAGSHTAAGTQGQDLAASLDGAKVYSASTAPAACSALNPADLSILYYLPTSNVPPNNVEVGSDGRVYCGVSGRNNSADVWVYNASGAMLQQIKFAPAGAQLVARQMAISGDGFLLLGLTDSGSLYVVPIGP